MDWRERRELERAEGRGDGAAGVPNTHAVSDQAICGRLAAFSVAARVSPSCRLPPGRVTSKNRLLPLWRPVSTSVGSSTKSHVVAVGNRDAGADRDLVAGAGAAGRRPLPSVLRRVRREAVGCPISAVRLQAIRAAVTRSMHDGAPVDCARRARSYPIVHPAAGRRQRDCGGVGGDQTRNIRCAAGRLTVRPTGLDGQFGRFAVSKVRLCPLARRSPSIVDQLLAPVRSSVALVAPLPVSSGVVMVPVNCQNSPMIGGLVDPATRGVAVSSRCGAAVGRRRRSSARSGSQLPRLRHRTASARRCPTR